MIVPKLRFKEFSEEWKKDKLKNRTKLITKGTTPLSFVDIGIKFIKIEGLEENKINNEKCLFIDEKTHNGYLKRSILEENDILFAIAGATIGKCGIVKYENLPANTNQALSIIRLDKNINPLFLLNILKSSNMKKYILLNISVGAQPNLNLEQMGKFLFYLPSKNEQDKISSLIELLDKKIELQNKKVETLKMYKKGLLYKNFRNNSTNYKIKDLLLIGKSGGTPKSTNVEYYNGTIPFLSITDMTSQGKYINQTEKHISNIGLKNSSAWLLPINTLILSMYASYGLISINKIELSTSQAMFNMIFKQNINIEYIYYYLNYLKLSHFYNELVSTGTQSNLNADKVKNIPVYVPSQSEQFRISTLFNYLDKKIELQENDLNNLVLLKKGLLQQMFI